MSQKNFPEKSTYFNFFQYFKTKNVSMSFGISEHVDI